MLLWCRMCTRLESHIKTPMLGLRELYGWNDSSQALHTIQENRDLSDSISSQQICLLGRNIDLQNPQSQSLVVILSIPSALLISCTSLDFSCILIRPSCLTTYPRAYGVKRRYSGTYDCGIIVSCLLRCPYLRG